MNQPPQYTPRPLLTTLLLLAFASVCAALATILHLLSRT
jgi:hypothetical protein